MLNPGLQPTQETIDDEPQLCLGLAWKQQSWVIIHVSSWLWAYLTVVLEAIPGFDPEAAWK